MPIRMLIDAAHEEETRVTIVRGNRVEEFDYESSVKRPLKGNVYLAKVTRVEPSLQAAFVEYGGNRHGFLAFSEIHPDYYQIPVADREALIAQEAQANKELHEKDEELDEAPAPKKRKPRKTRARKSKEKVEATEAEEKQETVEVSDAQDAETQETEAKETDTQETAVVEAAEAEETAAAETVAETAEEDSTDDDSEGPDKDTNKVISAAADEEVIVSEEIVPEGDDTPEAEVEADAEAEKPAKKVKAPRKRKSSKKTKAKKEEKTETEEEATEEVDASPEAPAGDVSEDSEDDVAVADNADVDNADDLDEDDAEAAHLRLQTVKRLRHKYKIQEVIKKHQIILIQVVKEERGNKGAALTTYLSLPGRYCVLMPNTLHGGGVSRKIASVTDRKRLKGILSELELPEGMACIVRTAGQSRTKSEIKRDYEYLKRMWETIREETLSSIAPSLIHEEGNLIKRSIRDLYTREVDEILVEGEAGYKTAKRFMKMLMPSHAKKVQHYVDTIPLFHRFQVESQLDSMYNPSVQMKSGGYIVINPTEALVSIDVNSGKATKEHNIEETARKTNLEAAEEVARQLRLRDMAGLVVIDFIDMEDRANIRAVEKKMRDCVKTDRARIQVGKISSFGLMEMSRQRLRSGVLESSTRTCPHCEGAGVIRTVESQALHVLRTLEEEAIRNQSSNIDIYLPSSVAIYLLNNKRNKIVEIEGRYDVTIDVAIDAELTETSYRLGRRAANSDKPAGKKRPERKNSLQMGTNVAASDADNDDEKRGEGSGEQPTRRRRRNRRRRRKGNQNQENNQQQTADENSENAENASDGQKADSETQNEGKPRRRRRNRRNRRSSDQQNQDAANTETQAEQADTSSDNNEEAKSEKPRRTRRRRSTKSEQSEGAASSDSPSNTETGEPKQAKKKPAAESSSSSDIKVIDVGSATSSSGSSEKSGEPAKKGWWKRTFGN